MLVDVARREAALVELAQKRARLARGDLADVVVAEGGHDPAGRGLAPSLVLVTRLAHQASVVADRGGRGALDVLEPAQPLQRDVAERHPACALATFLGLDDARVDKLGPPGRSPRGRR